MTKIKTPLTTEEREYLRSERSKAVRRQFMFERRYILADEIKGKYEWGYTRKLKGRSNTSRTST